LKNVACRLVVIIVVVAGSGRMIFLIENNVPPIKTHDLIKLNDLVKEIKDLAIDEQSLVIINEIL
jgi:hypothetical protein